MERTYSPEQIAQLASQVMSAGNAARGEEIFRREKLNCVKCHRVRGNGGEVGPDLSGIGASAPVDYLVESLLEPNKKVKENYHSMIVATVEGEIITGVPVQKTEEEIVLRNAENKLVSIATRDVEETKVGGSIMPVGLLDNVSSQELLDLVRYLSELGKPGPYGPSREILAKEWKLLGPMAPAEADKIQEGYVKAGAELSKQTENWQKSLVLNAGWVYLREFALKPQLPIVFASCDFVTEQPGKVRFAFEPGAPSKLWLDGKPLTPSQVVGNDAWYEVELTPGRHALLSRIDVSSAPNFLKMRVYPLDDTMDLRLLAGKP
jgi:putative heme-binding domain-containing protein